PASAATAAQAGAVTSTGTPVATTGVTGAPNSVTGAPATSPASGSATVPTVASSESGTGPLMPQHVSQLVWLGLSASTAAALEPYVTVLPVRTPLNINTASAEALFASAPALDLASAKRIVAQRTRGYFRSLADASASVQEKSPVFTEGQFSVSTRYFEVFGRLRLDRNWVQEHSLLQRDGLDLKIIWRERGAGATLPPPNS
ncbi:MAG: general secretion pathway protein GspK, partial [Gammaproteobacteria bacterium]|nr:general secretion pathway protein GspK [Gammaproteobacteria bacterium]